jgi:hypothetical protein
MSEPRPKKLGNILWAIAFPNCSSCDRRSPLSHCAIVPQIDSDAIALSPMQILFRKLAWEENGWRDMEKRC